MFHRVQYWQSLNVQFRRLNFGGLIMPRNKARGSEGLVQGVVGFL